MLYLMIGISSGAFFFSAALAAKHEHATLGTYLWVIVAALLLAGCNAWIIYTAVYVLAKLTASWSESQQEFIGLAFFF
jgi:hypothetical protein